jgi:hypothetical protein
LGVRKHVRFANDVRRGDASSNEPSVLVAGRLVVDGGKLLTIDEEDLVDEAVELGEKLCAELGPQRYRPLTTSSVK